jgi:hypothetical protein
MTHIDYNQALGVPLAQIGNYTIWPMLCAIPSKFIIAAWESSLVGRGTLDSTSQHLSTHQSACILVTGASGDSFILGMMYYSGICDAPHRMVGS